MVIMMQEAVAAVAPASAAAAPHYIEEDASESLDTTSHSLGPSGPITVARRSAPREGAGGTDPSVVDLLKDLSIAGVEDDREAIEMSFLELADLCMNDHPGAAENRLKLFELGGHHTVVYEMKQYADDARIQAEGCRLFMNMSCKHPGVATTSAQLGKADAIEVVVRAMKAHSGKPNLVRCAVGAVGNLVCNVPSNADRLLDAGGVPTVVAAMTADPRNAKLQRHGCRALYNLCVVGEKFGDDEQQRKRYASAIDFAGGTTALMAAIVNHRGEERVLKWSRKCLSKLRQQQHQQLEP